MHPSVMVWVEQVTRGLTHDADVVEVGSYNVNGTVRDLFPTARSYVGLDVEPGPGVDRVYDGLDLPLPDATADIVVSTEALEHCTRPWRVVREMARVARPGGLVVITARGWVVTRRFKGEGGVDVGEVACFAFHNPPDLWRYSGDALVELAVDAGLHVVDVQQDPQVPGWFIAARRPGT